MRLVAPGMLTEGTESTYEIAMRSHHMRVGGYLPPSTVEQARADVPYGQRAVVIHQPEDWPAGRQCRNCGGRWPCDVYTWGLQVLFGAEWTSGDVTLLLERAAKGEVPWGC